MNHIGIWKFHSIGVVNDENKLVYLNAEEYINSPMPYIDESDEEAVADEMKERKQMIGACVEVCEDGNLYMLMPLPEGVSKEEVDKAVAAGHIKVRNGMLCGQEMAWEEKDGELWFDTGIEGELFSETTDGRVKALDENGFFTFMTTRYIKED